MVLLARIVLISEVNYTIIYNFIAKVFDSIYKTGKIGHVINLAIMI